MEKFESVVINKNEISNQIGFVKSVKEQLAVRLSSGKATLTIRYICTYVTCQQLPNHKIIRGTNLPQQSKNTTRTLL